MSKILYRMKPQANNPEIFALTQKGYEVQQASRTLDFQAMEDKYRAAIYKKLPEVTDLLELEQLFAEFWHTHGKPAGDLIELVNMPQHLKMFSLPAELNMITAPVDVVLSNEKQLKDGVARQYLVICASDKPANETKKVPSNLVEELAELAKLDIDVNLLPLFYAQYHFQLTGELFYRSNLLWIVAQVLFERKGIKGLQVPVGKTTYTTVLPKGSWGPLQDADGYLKGQIAKELEAEPVEWTTASNQTSTEGLTVIPVTAPIKNTYDEPQFIQYLFKKLRPEEQGLGTIPFHIPIPQLYQAFLYETYGCVYSRLTIIAERRELVTKLNAYHAMRYNTFLKGRRNCAELQLEYFGQLKHPASSDAAIKRGQIYQTKSISNVLDSQDVIF